MRKNRNPKKIAANKREEHESASSVAEDSVPVVLSRLPQEGAVVKKD
jgi:hypothetical protein